MTPIMIAGKAVGPGHPSYIIAELSANHGQDYDQAVRLIKAAATAGVDAVKLQTYTADTITIRSDRPEFRIGGGTLWDGKTLHDLYGEAYTPWDWQPRLMEVAHDLGLHLFSSPFDPTAVDFLERMKVPAYKVASFELVDLPLIECMARTGKPLIMSTGMATPDEIAEALATARGAGAYEISLLKCTSGYPAPPEEMDLRTIPDMQARFDVPVGLSDHTLGIAVPVAAIALGACIVEKHLTLDRNVPGPDSAFSLEPHEFKALVDSIRIAEKALGKVNYELTAKEIGSRHFRRSLYVVRDMAQGEIFTAINVRSIRPANGLPPRHWNSILGQRAKRSIEQGTPLSWDLVDQGNSPSLS